MVFEALEAKYIIRINCLFQQLFHFSVIFLNQIIKYHYPNYLPVK